MSIDWPYKPCAICGEDVLFEDSDNTRWDNDEVLSVSGPMHVGCFDAALAEAQAGATEMQNDATL